MLCYYRQSCPSRSNSRTDCGERLCGRQFGGVLGWGLRRATADPSAAPQDDNAFGRARNSAGFGVARKGSGPKGLDLRSGIQGPEGPCSLRLQLGSPSVGNEARSERSILIAEQEVTAALGEDVQMISADQLLKARQF
jgi:hypothetical protein